MMLEEKIAPLLDTLDGFSYTKYEFENYFDKEAIPGWQIWEQLQKISKELLPKFVIVNLDASLQIFR